MQSREVRTDVENQNDPTVESGVVFVLFFIITKAHICVLNEI